MTEKELLVMNKLEYLKEIRYRMQEIDRMRSSINEELDLVNVEERCLQEYRREMDSLYQEKMTHVEELRQIHSDINMLENVLKQSEEDRNRHVDNVKRLHHHLQQMKDGVEKMRVEIGLPRLNENLNNQNQKDEDALMLDKLDLVLDAAAKRHGNTSSYLKGEFELKATTMDPLVAKQLSSSNTSTNAAMGSGSSGSTNIVSNKPFADNTNTSGSNSSTAKSLGTAGAISGGAYSSSLASLMSGFQDLHTGSRLSGTGASGQAGSLGSYHHTDHHHGTSSSVSSASSVTPNSVASAAAAAAFRQQPPPMKSCLSCHQQIHRNAPICPLCKAKSRSRHPKRRNQPKQN